MRARRAGRSGVLLLAGLFAVCAASLLTFQLVLTRGADAKGVSAGSRVSYRASVLAGTERGVASSIASSAGAAKRANSHLGFESQLQQLVLADARVRLGVEARRARVRRHVGKRLASHRRVASTVPQRRVTGSASVKRPVLRLPRGVRVVHQLPLSSANTRAFVTSTGTRVAMVYPAAVNYKSSNGHYAAINTSAVSSGGGGWTQNANDWNAQLPSN